MWAGNEIIEEKGMTGFDDRRYNKTHEWVRIENGVATVGISDYAQSELGDVTFVDPMQAGETVEQGDECGTIESVKAASEIYAPLSGEIAETNKDLDDHPGLINEDPYERGWILKIKDFDPREVERLMSEEEYEASLEQEE